MGRSQMERLNILFEKMVSNNADYNERYELKMLYQEYINHGRGGMVQNQSSISNTQASHG